MTATTGSEYVAPLSLRHDVWDVLVEECRAHNALSSRREFVSQWPECAEFRFMGSLGFGGKVWWNGGRIYVTCYPEHRSDERDLSIQCANERLAKVQAEHFGRKDGPLHSPCTCGADSCDESMRYVCTAHSTTPDRS